MTPEVSVIIPLYNKAKTVAASISSVCSQTWKDLEIVVVDDGSVDDSVAIVRGIRDARIRLIQQKNGGPGAARNTGIDHARGSILAFLDADDEWMPEFLERSVPLLSADPSLGAVTFAWFEDPGHISTVPRWRKRSLSDGVQVVSSSTPGHVLVAMAAFMWPCTTITRRDIALRYGGFYAKNGCRYGEDAHLWMKIVLNHPVRYVMEPMATYHREASELSGNYVDMRPVEPFLTDPDDLRRCCGESLRLPLEQFLTLRAMKTACVLAYWGRWRDALALRRRFFGWECWRYPIFWTSALIATPLGSLAGRLLRRMRNSR